MKQQAARLSILLLAIALVLGDARLSAAQDDDAERIRAAYAAYASWDSFRVEVDDLVDYAMTAQGSQVSIWQKRERDLTLAGGYDVSDPDDALISLTASTNAAGSTDRDDAITRETWDIALSVAQRDGDLFWQGSYDATPDDDFSLPRAWSAFSVEDDTPPGVTDLTLTRYLLREDADPFAVDVAAWLDAAESIEGPQSFALDRATRGELYVIAVDLAAVPEVYEGRFPTLTDGPDALVSRETLADQLAENGALTWGVLIDPQNGALMAQFVQLDLEAELSGSALESPYNTLSMDYSNTHSVIFRDVNEPVELPDDLP